MRTIEMEIALMKHFKFLQNVIVPNVKWGMVLGGTPLHECDLLVLSKSNYATEIEIKVDKGDLLKDKAKSHNHKHPYIKFLYFAVPEKLKEVALNNIPERAGLLVVSKRLISNTYYDDYYIYHIDVVKPAIRNPKTQKWSFEDKNKLMRLGTMRIYNLKKKILKLYEKTI